ncbi:MAG: DNA topoisomerase IV subunit B, partial [Clostridia bacterium]|nr:DNA topoisomerase IV subunit B [Clostridia bacterium]
ELAKITKDLKKYTIQRYKGLGEMDYDQLRETTLDPAKRTIIRVGVEDAVLADKEITLWMGDEIGARKDYINKYANFNRIDEFEQKQIEEIEEGGKE